MNTSYPRTILLLLIVASFAPAQTVVNGDFEDVNISPDFFTFDSSKVPGWTRSGDMGDGLLGRLGYSDSQGSVTVAGHGSQFAILGGGFNAPGTASWTTMMTNLIPGTNYVLSFLISNEGELASQSITVSLPTGSSTSPQTFTTTFPGRLYWKVWEPQTMQFVATATTATLQFSVVNQQYDIGLDDVRVATAPSPLVITTASPLPGATAGVNYSQTIVASGGTPPYSFSTATPPPGLTLSVTGILSGTPNTSGTFPFTVQVTDSAQVTATKMLQLTVTSSSPLIQVSPLGLSFSALVGGDSPPPQVITVLSVSGAPIDFAVVVDGGASNTAAPWLSVRPLTGRTPGRLIVSVDQSGLQATSYLGRIRVVVPNDTTQNPIDIAVTLVVKTGSPMLDVVPSSLRFAARAQSPGILDQPLLVRNSGGGGPLGFSVAVMSQSPWLSVSAASGQTALNMPISIHVQANTQGLRVGGYHGLIRLTGNTSTFDVPVELFVADNGSILGLNVTGVRFQSRQNNGTSIIQNVNVLNLGDSASTVNWTAKVVLGADIVDLVVTAGTATLLNPGVLPLKPSAASIVLPAGGHYALVKVSDPQALNSPQYITAVLDQADAATQPKPDPAPPGLIFIAAGSGSAPAAQSVAINVDSTVPVAFQASAWTSNGGTWLSVTPATGMTPVADRMPPAQASIKANQSGLTPGIYTGEVDIGVGNSLRAVNVTLIVTPAGSSSIALAHAPLATSSAGCSPSKLALTQTGLVNNFSVPAGWPAALIVQLNDDCGNSVPGGSVTASFSNVDPPLMLRGDPSGAYSTTWQPGVVTPQMVVTLNAEAGTLMAATSQLIGGINENQNAPPMLSKNGTVNVFNRVPAGAVAPAMIVEVYGSGLATTKGNPGVLPLPTSFQGTSMFMGGYQVPLYFVSGGQLDVEIAAELAPNQQYPIIVSLNGALSLPDMIDVNTVQLGIAALADGNVIAQHGADSSYVDSTHPAKPGEVLVMYLSGMGPTNPSVKSGDPAPTSEPLARVTIQPTVTVDGQNATVQFAGLTPGFVGLYQINFQVPSNVSSGDVTLAASQNGVSSNTTTLPVGR